MSGDIQIILKSLATVPQQMLFRRPTTYLQVTFEDGLLQQETSHSFLYQSKGLIRRLSYPLQISSTIGTVSQDFGPRFYHQTTSSCILKGN